MGSIPFFSLGSQVPRTSQGPARGSPRGLRHCGCLCPCQVPRRMKPCAESGETRRRAAPLGATVNSSCELWSVPPPSSGGLLCSHCESAWHPVMLRAAAGSATPRLWPLGDIWGKSPGKDTQTTRRKERPVRLKKTCAQREPNSVRGTEEPHEGWCHRTRKDRLCGGAPSRAGGGT